MLCSHWGSSHCGGSCVGYSSSGCFCRRGNLFHRCPHFRLFLLFLGQGCIFFCDFSPPRSLSFLATAFRPALGLVVAGLVAIVAFYLVLVSAPVLAFATAGVRSQGFILRFSVLILNLASLGFVNHELLKYFCCKDFGAEAHACADGRDHSIV